MTKILKADKRVSKQVKAVVSQLIDIHETYKHSYFWNANSSASGRRSSEKNFSRKLPSVDGIITKDGVITWSLSYSESCQYCYYSADFYLDGHKKDIRILKKLLK